MCVEVLSALQHAARHWRGVTQTTSGPETDTGSGTTREPAASAAPPITRSFALQPHYEPRLWRVVLGFVFPEVGASG